MIRARLPKRQLLRTRLHGSKHVYKKRTKAMCPAVGRFEARR